MDIRPSDNSTSRVAIVTGAAGGVGREVVRLLMERKVVVVGVDKKPEISRLSGEANASFVGCVGDVRDKETSRQAVQLATDRWQRIDILIATAGCTFPKSIVDTTEEEWDQMMDFNVRRIYLLCREVLPAMLRDGGGLLFSCLPSQDLLVCKVNRGIAALMGQ
jgi:NADP-dependent 3-hydroxy acid dehydrogenase YdfG